MGSEVVASRGENKKNDDALRGASRRVLARLQMLLVFLRQAEQAKELDADRKEDLSPTLSDENLDVLLGRLSYSDGKVIEQLEVTLRRLRAEIDGRDGVISLKRDRSLARAVKLARRFAQDAVETVSRYTDIENP